MNGKSCFDIPSGKRFFLVTEYIHLNFVQVFKPWNLVESHRHFEIANRLMCQWVRTTKGFWICSLSSADISIQTLSISMMPRKNRRSKCYHPDS